MALSEKWVRKQLNILKPFVTGSRLETARRSQDAVGKLMYVSHRGLVTRKEQRFDGFTGEWILPKDETREGVILYLHGGGYTCGGAEYARGFGTLLAEECGIRVFCVSYRLAPEHRFPAAPEDVLTAYRYLVNTGTDPKKIILCGESAGGGLCYVLPLMLKKNGEDLPGGIIAISPWTDLTHSGESYRRNRDVDPSMTLERLQCFADQYTDDKTDPLVSPLFGDLAGMPSSLIFSGGDEIMADDAAALAEKLHASGSEASLIIRPHMWHAYVLYALKEYKKADFAQIRSFLDAHLPAPRKLRWMKLDNAAKIFPASRRRNWSNVFRLSVSLREEIDPAILQSALDVTVRRFPSIAVRLRRGVFWYYLEEIKNAPKVRPDGNQPLKRMPLDDIRTCAFRVLYYRNRFAVEFFHAVTDGTGGLIFLKSLAAEYLKQKYGAQIPAEKGVKDRLEEPAHEEMTDSFLESSGDFSGSRKEEKAFRLDGTLEKDRFLHLTCGTVPIRDALGKAKEYGVSLTALLSAVLVESIIRIQNEQVRRPASRLPVKVAIPVNLRRLFGGCTMRNFVMVVNVGVDPRLGEYSFEELCRSIHHQMGLEITPQKMRAAFTVNVKSERNPFIRMIPLFLKNIVMRSVFDAVGESRSCLCLSNLGAIEVPEEMKPYLTRIEFIIGPQAKAPYNCGVCSFGDTLYLNMVRNTTEPTLEKLFYTRLLSLGLPVTLESNQR